MELDEKAMRFLEEQIPALAEIAVSQAYWQTLAAGCSVLIIENETLLRVSPDGSKEAIKKISQRLSHC